MKTKYNFYVKHGKEVDIPRIIKEAPPEVDAILLVSDNAFLMLRMDLLERFRPSDSQIVAGGTMHGSWGTKFLTADSTQTGVRFRLSGGSIEGWKGYTLEKENIGEVLKQLEAARSYVPHREVRVSYV